MTRLRRFSPTIPFTFGQFSGPMVSPGFKSGSAPQRPLAKPQHEIRRNQSGSTGNRYILLNFILHQPSLVRSPRSEENYERPLSQPNLNSKLYASIKSATGCESYQFFSGKISGNGTAPAMMGVYKNTPGCELLETVHRFLMSSQAYRYTTQSSF